MESTRQTSDGSAAPEKPATNVVSTASATQCAAVRIRSPFFESSTPAVHVCRSPAPRNSAPILASGGTGAAVIFVVVGEWLDTWVSGSAVLPQPAVTASSP